MPTTTIRLEDALKARIAAVAEQAGKTAHAFILEAIEGTVLRVEQEEELNRIADERWSQLLRTRRSVGWDDAKTYLHTRAEGKQARKPAARRPAR